MNFREASQDSAGGGGGWFGGLGALMQQAQNYLPTQVNELITVERSFATARLPGSDKKNIAALTKSVRTFSTPFLQPDEFSV